MRLVPSQSLTCHDGAKIVRGTIIFVRVWDMKELCLWTIDVPFSVGDVVM